MNQTRTASEMLAQLENDFVALSFFFFLPFELVPKWNMLPLSLIPHNLHHSERDAFP